MKFSYLWLKNYLPKLPQVDKLAEIITLHAFEVKSIEKWGSDSRLNIDVLPNRAADASGHEGMAREIATILGMKLKISQVNPRESQTKKAADLIHIAVRAGRVVPRYVARVVEGVKVDESPEWMKERLEVCGIRAINNIVDAANYVMLELGQPAHVFDADKLAGSKIIVRQSKDGEEITTLDDENIKLPGGVLIVADEEGPIAIAGIKGGKRAGISEETKRVVIEAANFDRATIRKTSRMLKLITDASIRFSAGFHPELASITADRLAEHLRNVAKGSIAKGKIDIGVATPPLPKITFTSEHLESMLGIKIDEREAVQILSRMGATTSRIAPKRYRVIPPLLRTDLENEADLIEEVGRIVGYDRIAPRPPLAELATPHANDEHNLREDIRSELSSLGFSESINYAFMSGVEADAVLLNTRDLVQVENPIAPEYALMRATLVTGLLKNLALNTKHVNGYRAFEIGRVFRKASKTFSERDHVQALLVGSSKNADQLLLKGKGYIDAFLERLGIPDHGFVGNQKTVPEWPLIAEQVRHPFRYAAIDVGGAVLGAIYEIHPEVLRRFGISRRVVSFEFALPELLKLLENEKEFRPISRFPAALRDLSILVPKNVLAEAVEQRIEQTGGELLVDTDLFDYYEDDSIGSDRRSLLFRLIFQSDERTLRDEEIDKVMDRIVRAIELEVDWEVRR